MDNPNYNEAGLIAFALVNSVLQGLIEKGLLTADDARSIVADAAGSFAGDSRINYKAAGDFLKMAALQKPAAK